MLPSPIVFVITLTNVKLDRKSTPSMRISHVVLLVACVADVTGCIDILCAITSNLLKNGIYEWIRSSVSDEYEICPSECTTCRRDIPGYLSLGRILRRLDGDGDGRLVFGEALATAAGEKVVYELNEDRRDFRVLFHPEQTSITYVDAWHTWTRSSGSYTHIWYYIIYLTIGRYTL